MAPANRTEIVRMRPSPAGSVPAVAAALSILLSAAGVAKAEDGVACPFEIEVTQTLAEPVAGWTSEVDPWPTELVNLSVFDGPPEELAELIYDEEIEDTETWTVSWLLQADNSRGYWIRCRYANTLVTITQQLPAGVTRCDMVFEKQMSYADGRPVVRSMLCR
jgi:hypothetical protein